VSGLRIGLSCLVRRDLPRQSRDLAVAGSRDRSSERVVDCCYHSALSASRLLLSANNSSLLRVLWRAWGAGRALSVTVALPLFCRCWFPRAITGTGDQILGSLGFALGFLGCCCRDLPRQSRDLAVAGSRDRPSERVVDCCCFSGLLSTSRPLLSVNNPSLPRVLRRAWEAGRALSVMVALPLFCRCWFPRAITGTGNQIIGSLGFALGFLVCCCRDLPRQSRDLSVGDSRDRSSERVVDCCCLLALSGSCSYL